MGRAASTRGTESRNDRKTAPAATSSAEKITIVAFQALVPRYYGTKTLMFDGGLQRLSWR